MANPITRWLDNRARRIAREEIDAAARQGPVYVYVDGDEIRYLIDPSVREQLDRAD